MARLSVSTVFIFMVLTCTTAHAADVLTDDTFAVINGEHVSAASYYATVNSGMRQRFYHGNIPDAELTAFRKEMADKIVDSILLLQEAKRKKIEPDHASVQQQLDNYERRYGESAHWKARKDKLLPGLRTQLENHSRLERIRKELMDIARPDDNAVEKYYNKYPEKFTTPKKHKVSLILLKVEPSSSKSVWNTAHDEAATLIERMKSGESFAELAKLHSGDTQSAGKGGDMGYLHQGMLAEEAEAVLEKLTIGELSEPVRTLEGVVILRLEDVSPPKLNPLESVKERATELLYREMAEKSMDDALTVLRNSAELQINMKLVDEGRSSAH